MTQPAGTSPARTDDLALARRVASGDETAFELLMRRHNRRLYRIARSVLRDAAEAEDALQEAYLAAYASIGGFRGEATLATWLSRLVLNECFARRRREQRRQRIVPIVSGLEPQEDQALQETSMSTDDPETPDRALVRAELRALLERKLDALPSAFRTVFMLRCVEELTVEETAQLLEIPEATVRSRQFRARNLLRSALAQELDGAEHELFAFDGERCDRIVARVLGQLPPPR